MIISMNAKNKIEKEIVGRIPPQNIDAEKSLLGSILLKPIHLLEIIDRIEEDDFYVYKHRLIFRAMLELSRIGDPIDLVSLAEKMKAMGTLKQIGGILYLNEIAKHVPNASNIDYYQKIVKTKSILRKLIEAGEFITKLGYEENKDIDEILDQSEKKIFQITSNPNTKNTFLSMKDLVPKSWERIEKLSEGELRGIPSGFQALDDILSGFQQSDLIILAARPSTGKTALALDIARKIAIEQGKAVAFFSLEMSADQLTDRMLSAEAKVDAWRIRTGRGLTEDDFARISQAMETLSHAPLYIDDTPGNTILSMKATARRLKAEHKLEIIFVDYLQLMHPTRHYDSMVNQVTEISRSLKSLARELNVPVIALSQLSRAVESRGGKPRLSDLRDSGSIEQDADVVIFLHRERKEDEVGRSDIVDVLIEKHRNGATGYCKLFFDSARTTFLEIDTKHQDDEFDGEF